MQLNPRLWLFGFAFGLILAGIVIKLLDAWGTFGHTLGPWIAGLIILLVALSITFFIMSLLARKEEQGNL